MTDTARLARLLAKTRSELVLSTRPVDRKTLTARMDGLCDAAHALDLGATPFALNLAACDAVSTHGTMPPATAMNTARTLWLAAVTDDITAALAN